MDLARIADRLTRTIEDQVQEIGGLFDPVIRLGVTGLSRAGKTVFVTSLVANLLERARMPQLRAAAQGRFLAAWLQPQPDHAVPRFPFEDHLAALLAPEPRWPEGTRSISTLRLSLRLAPSGLLAGLSGPRVVHLDITDYPGEWLLDLPLMSLSFTDWSQAALAAARTPARAALAEGWLARLDATDAAAPLDESAARGLAAAFTGYLAAARAAGLSSVAPGRFLMPGDLEGSPALTFSPLPRPGRTPSGSLWRAFEKRFESYKRVVVEPFFRNHFAKLDRQVVLIDALGALHDGPRAVEDLRVAMTDILACFRPGANSWLAPILGRRIDRILFAATRADHVHHSQHARLAAVAEALVAEARRRAQFRGAETGAMAIASLRATTEATVTRDGRSIDVVRGRSLDTGAEVALYPGLLPEDPAGLLAAARDAGGGREAAAWSVPRFAPPRLTLAPGDGLPHIRLDRAAEFLFGDKL
ncbi:YcjX family protein [Amaricoccus sp.]|uniref:YcjX family protein n=1 Tax=Amaricoccus sp. TaxID=1872485 RepID=UPI001B47F7B2|nr:YcjX family protein [Amaricoccus sp.]MBP7002981.1 YcjX family protein [Amaricoccus sp.]